MTGTSPPKKTSNFGVGTGTAFLGNLDTLVCSRTCLKMKNEAKLEILKVMTKATKSAAAATLVSWMVS